MLELLSRHLVLSGPLVATELGLPLKTANAALRDLAAADVITEHGTTSQNRRGTVSAARTATEPRLASVNGTLAHRHGPWTHEHHHHGSHRHIALPIRSHELSDHEHHHDHEHDGHHHDDHAGPDHRHGEHGHTHGRVDPSIVRSREGVRAVSISLGVLGTTAVLQIVIFVLSGSVALLADLIHNAGDALTAIPLAIAFLARSERGERWAGYFVVLTIFVSATVAAIEAVDRLVHPQHLQYLGALAAAGVIGFVGNELAARVRLRAGARLHSPALVADGHHARTDGFVSLGVVASAVVVAIGPHVADPLIGLAITAVILRITWQAWSTIRQG